MTPPALRLLVLLLRRPVARVLAALLLSLPLLGLPGLAHALAWRVLTADDLPAHAEFVRALREPAGQAAAAPAIEIVRLDAGGALPAAAPESNEDSVVAGVRTRSLTRDAPAAHALPPEGLTIALGAAAARAALAQPGREPLLLAMLSRLDYEDLRSLPALRQAQRRVGVLLREPAMADQLALVDAVLPGKRRLGLVVTGESAPMVEELRRAAAATGSGWQLNVEAAPDARSLAAALRAVLQDSDALMVLPDLIGDSQAATLAVLRAGASAGLPVFGTSEGMVRSGALAAAVSTPAQLARQARGLGERLVASAGQASAAPLVEGATPASVRVNATVARGLKLRVPSEQELAQRLSAPR